MMLLTQQITHAHAFDFFISLYMSMMHSEEATPHLNFDQNLDECDGGLDSRPYGNITPFKNSPLGLELYENPQCGMLFFTILLTLTLQTVMLKFVFFGIHFYIGCGLCAFILYLLLSLGFSNPGLGFEDYQQMQYHFDVEGCSEKCRHQGGINQAFKYFCQKCSTPSRERTRHCSICNVCVYEYDHHCVFIGKCVGGNNYGRFKMFLCMIFSTLIYGFVTALASLSDIKQAHQ